jgi:very-short-patch-repair endonuclease
MNVDTDADSILANHAADSHGVFRGTHARLAGLTDGQITRRIAARRWQSLYRDVYRVSGAPETWRGDLLAACWAGGDRAVGSHVSAAEVHLLPGRRRDPLEITCPRWRRAHRKGLTVHETKALELIDISIVDGIPITSVARTLFDLGGTYGKGMVELALENALRRGLVTEAELLATVNRLSRSGRPGGPILRELLAARAPKQRATESEMETRLLQAIRRHELPLPIAQHEVWDGNRRLGRVDFAYPDARVAIEYDSDEFHSGRVPTRRDRARRHELIAASWLPIDVGPTDLGTGGTLTCAAIARALRDRRPIL